MASSKRKVRLVSREGTALSQSSLTRMQLFPDGADPAAPSDDATVWRYLSPAKFIDILSSRALWLSRVDLLNDRFEGTTPWVHVENRKSQMSVDDGLVVATVHETVRRWVTVNCWYLSDDESDSMWRLYAPNNEGVAVKSSIGRLIAQVKPAATAPDTNPFSPLPHDFYVGPVCYADIRRVELVDSDPMARFFLKRPDFSHEKEYRVVAVLPELLSEEGVGDAREPSCVGISIPIDPAALVQEVVVCPLAKDFVHKAVVDIIKAFAPTIRCRPSSFDDPPRF